MHGTFESIARGNSAPRSEFQTSKFDGMLRDVFNKEAGDLVHNLKKTTTGFPQIANLPFDKSVHQKAQTFMNHNRLDPRGLTVDLRKEQFTTQMAKVNRR